MELTEKLDYLRVLVLAENTVPFAASLRGQHGLSYLVEGKKESAAFKLVMDVGQDHETLCFNMKELNVSAGEIDAIMLSHCHYDHTSGVARLLADTEKEGVPVIAHPDIFRTHFLNTPVLRYIGMTAQECSGDALVAAGGRPFLTRDPLSLMPGLTTTGEVPRVTSFEEGVLKAFSIKEGHTVEDNIPDDLSLVACVEGLGLVVITGCSHAGIINIIKQACSLFPGEELYAVLGGLHLAGASRERIDRTVTELASFNPQLVSAGHCTGFQAQAALYNALGDRFVPLTCGAEFVFK